MKNKIVMKKSIFLVLISILVLFCLRMIPCFGDEGMWTFDNPPLKQLKERYGFTPTSEWLDHVRLSCVRIGGGSGSFVSPKGLIMTNHHVAVGQLQKISTKEMNYVEIGFFARTLDDEIKCPDQEVIVLMSLEDVTKKVLSAVKKGMTEEEDLKARQARIAKIEKKSMDRTGLTSTVVNLYHGGEYWLYRYKKFTDVRMVFAPERQAAYFGGDFDNFTYPRYDLDVSFFRIYENGKPVKTNHFLKWNASGAEKDELVFVPGNPGSSDRLFTYSQLEAQRDYFYPMILSYIKKRIDILHKYAEGGEEHERRALISLFGLENAKKALTGEYQGLLDEKLLAKRKQDEEKFRKLISANPKWKETYGDAWDTITGLMKKQSEGARERFYRRLMGSRLMGLASSFVFYSIEVKKPDSERLDGYHDSNLERVKFRLLSPAPIYLDMDEANLAGCLELSLEELGPDDPFIKTVLQGRTPEQAAKDLIQGTKMHDLDLRKTLFEGGEEAILKSKDPLIVLARKLEPMSRANIEWSKKNIESVLAPAAEKIARARFDAFGKDAYPDATFTLRLSYGTVKGYPMNGTKAPCKTTLFGLYDRAISFDQEKDYKLPSRFWDNIYKLDLSTPVNFVSACDIMGGNSGSPVINRNAEVVGLIFDGNIESLSGRFVFDEVKNRAVSVHTAYITEALQKLYDAGSLVDEIIGK